MTAAEWLAEVKARNTQNEIAAGTPSRDIFTFREGEVGFVMAAGWSRASADVRVLVAAIEAVLALVEETRLPAPDSSLLGGRVSATRLYAAITAALDAS